MSSPACIMRVSLESASMKRVNGSSMEQWMSLILEVEGETTRGRAVWYVGRISKVNRPREETALYSFAHVGYAPIMCVVTPKRRGALFLRRAWVY